MGTNVQHQFRFMALSTAATRREGTGSSSVQPGHKSASGLLPEAPAEEDRACPALTGINYRPFPSRPEFPSQTHAGLAPGGPAEKQLLGCVCDKTQSSDLDRAKEGELFEEGNTDDSEATVSTCTGGPGPGTVTNTYVYYFILTSQQRPKAGSIAHLILQMRKVRLSGTE